MERNITANVDFALGGIVYWKLKQKTVHYLMLSAGAEGVQSKHFGFVAEQTVIFNGNWQL